MLSRVGKHCFSSNSKLGQIENALKKLRIYKDEPTKDLFMYLSMLKACSYDKFVKNVGSIYKSATEHVGKNRMENFTKNYFAKRFIGGEDLESVLKLVQRYNSYGFSTIANFAIECKTEGHYTFEEMENFTNTYIQTIHEVSKCSMQNSIAIKLSALVEERILLALNKTQKDFIQVMRTFPSGIDIPFPKFLEKIHALGYVFNDEELPIVKTALNVKDDLIEWKSWPLYNHVYNVKNPCLPFLRISGIQESDLPLLNNLCTRLHKIFSAGIEKNCIVMVDAEQSYLQFIFSSVTEQFQEIYNKEKAIVLNTIQNYLKDSVPKIEEEIRRCHLLSLPFGLKMVRGAYMNEENKLASEMNLESPVCETFEQTTYNLHKNLKNLNENLIPGSKIIIASHNLKTNELGESFPNENFSHAQLLGLGDHLSFWLKNHNKRVYKYIPFGKLEVLMPYLLRRAQESGDLMKKNSVTYNLVKDEVRKRISGSN